MTNMHVNLLDFALASLAQLSLVIPLLFLYLLTIPLILLNCVNWWWQCPIARNLWDFFASVWCIVCPCIGKPLLWMVLQVLGLKSVVPWEQGRLCSSCSRQSMWSNPSAGWPSLASIHHFTMFISLATTVKFAWPLGRRSSRWPSASDSPKAIIVSEMFVLSLSLLGPISMPLVSYTWELRSLSLSVCAASLQLAVIAWVLYVVQYDWYLSLISLSTVLSGEHA